MKQQSIGSRPQWNKTRVSSQLGIEYPIIQGPLGGLSTQRLTAAVSNFGGLGSFGAHGWSPSAIRDVISEIRALTTKPFAINLWVSMEGEGARTSGSEAFARSLAPLAEHIQALGGTLPPYRPYVSIKFEDQVRALLDAKVPAFSFIYGIPPKEILDECRAQGILTMGTATTPDEAIVLEQAGVDVIAASGFEAGGHNGREETTSMILIPAVSAAVKIPVIAAGGIATGRQMLAAMVLGAEGVQMGSRFVASVEASAHPDFKEKVIQSVEGDTVLTMKQLTPVRMMKNDFYRQVQEAEWKGAAIEELKALLGRARAKKGMFEGELDEGELEIGQSSVLLHRILPAGEIVKKVWNEFCEGLSSPVKML